MGRTASLLIQRKEKTYGPSIQDNWEVGNKRRAGTEVERTTQKLRWKYSGDHGGSTRQLQRKQVTRETEYLSGEMRVMVVRTCSKKGPGPSTMRKSWENKSSGAYFLAFPHWPRAVKDGEMVANQFPRRDLQSMSSHTAEWYPMGTG